MMLRCVLSEECRVGTSHSPARPLKYVCIHEELHEHRAACVGDCDQWKALEPFNKAKATCIKAEEL